MVSERIKSKLARMKEWGLRIGGQVRYGQAVKDKEVVENGAEKALVGRIMQLKMTVYLSERLPPRSMQRVTQPENKPHSVTTKFTGFCRLQHEQT